MPSLVQTQAFLEREKKARYAEMICQSQKEHPFLWSALRTLAPRANNTKILKWINQLPEILQKDKEHIHIT